MSEGLDAARSINDRLLALLPDVEAAEADRDAVGAAALIPEATASLDAACALGESGIMGSAYQVMARVHLVAGDAPAAITYCSQGETVLVGTLSTPSSLAASPLLERLLEIRKVHVQALAVQQDSAGLVALAQETIQMLEARRARLHDPFQQASFLVGRGLFYEMFAFGSFKLGHWDDLLTAIDLLKARASYLKQAAPPAPEDRQISAKLAAVNATLTGAAPDSPAYRAAAEQRRLLISLRAITLSADDEDAAADAIPRLKVAEVQATLAPDEAVVAWVWITPEVLVVLAFDAARVQAERISLSPAVRGELDDYVDALRAQRIDPASLDARIERLAQVLLPTSVRALIASCRRLVLSPHRALHLVPFHACRLGERWLIEQCAVRYTATVGSLLVRRVDDSKNAGGGLFALGIDEFGVPGERWPTLKQAENEVAEVADAWRRRSQPVQVVTGPAATVTAWRALGSRLAHFRCLHIATHGVSVFDREAKNDPLAARLILQDGALDALALSQLRLGADVVVLSACNSGQRALGGRGLAEYPGDDNFGLQAAFFETGVRGVIGALWPVVDEVAPQIMKSLQEGLADGRPPDLALQGALVEYLGRPDSRRDAFAWGQVFLSAVGPNR